ncbi:acyl-CoA thioesterase [soil metagenome]
MTFVTRTPVRFAHIDAAGIVFYPRYFEMINAALEDFFAEVVGVDFNVLHLERGIGVPTVKLDSAFQAPGRLGEMLDIAVSVDRCGNSSATLRFEVTCNGAPRMTVRSVIVCMDLKSAQSRPWPQDIHARLAPASPPVPYGGGCA